MYGRTLDGEVLIFGHEGVLYRNSFALSDESEKYGYSVGSGTGATLYSYDVLVDEFIVEHGGQLIVYIEESDTVRAYARDFQLDDNGLLSDGQGASGIPRPARMRPKEPTPWVRLPSTPWLTKRWKSFYADGEVIDAESL